LTGVEAEVQRPFQTQQNAVGFFWGRGGWPRFVFPDVRRARESMTDLTGRKPILCLDFDGVCHSYTSGWKGAAKIPDASVPGLFEFLVQAVEVFEVNIFSSRSGQEGGIPAMRQWFIDEAEISHPHWTGFMPKDKAIEWVDANLKFPTDKPPAFIGIDDRVITFTGNWPSIESLKNFKPWNQLGVSGEASK
jgi:hypothetical protein